MTGTTRCVVLLRGVNVGKHNRISMPDFARALQRVGCTDVSTYLQSGNGLVTADPAGLPAAVERDLRETLRLDVRVLVRTGQELAQVVAANPFPDRVGEPKQLHAAFLDGPLPPDALDKVVGRHGDDEIRPGDRLLYLSYAGASQDSPLVPVLRRLGVVATARNWTTVTGLLARLDVR